MRVLLERVAGQEIHRVLDGERVVGWVVIDSLVAGSAAGGWRMLPDLAEAEVRDLARAMTLKLGFLGLRQGGAKAGLIAPPAAEGVPAQSRARLRAMGHAILPLLRTRRYVPGPDMGTSTQLIRGLLAELGLPLARRELRGECSGAYTARTVLAGIVAGTRRCGLDLAGATVAIEGFGKVGRGLAGWLAGTGARVVAVSTCRGAIYRAGGFCVDALLAAAERDGERFVEEWSGPERLARDELLELPVDILCPCARGASLHEANAPRIRARVISPGANNAVTAPAEARLWRQGAICLPDFVTNSGGVLGGTMQFAAVPERAIFDFLDTVMGAQIERILELAEAEKVSPRTVAERLATERRARVRAGGGGRGFGARSVAAVLAAYRRGLVPGRFVAPLALRFLRRTLQ